ncbi:hypothetical protein, partial [Citricoccus sp.]|uniref:hypothetical protein n=1 Tax=Citricoccus sp. TaxID=1978372 RepID=UPI0028BD8AE8
MRAGAGYGGEHPSRVIAASAVLTVALAASACTADGGAGSEKRTIPHQSFVSRPDLMPPVV